MFDPPVIAGVPRIETQALIVTPPTVELAPEPKIIEAREIPPMGGMDVTVFIRDRATGQRYRIECQAFATEWEPGATIELTSHDDGGFREFLRGLLTLTMRATGQVKTVRVS